MDGTHGVHVNRRIRVRDQDLCPVAADVKRVQRAQAESDACRALAIDVKEAHRLTLIHQSDWRLQACRAKPEGFKFVSVALSR